MRVSFTHAGDGLVAKEGELKSFELAGSDGIFHPAQAVIEGNEVVVSSKEVPQPQAVRYAWSNTPDVTLFGMNDLPAGPFEGGNLVFKKAFTGNFDGVPPGFWGSALPEGWASTDATRTYTTAVGFVQVPPGVILTGTTNRTIARGDQYALTADLGADEGGTTQLRLVATEKADGLGKKVVLGKIDKTGSGRYNFEPAQISTPAADSVIEGYTLFIEVESYQAGLGFFDNLTLQKRSD